MKRKYLKILIVVILACTLVAILYFTTDQKGPKALSGVGIISPTNAISTEQIYQPLVTVNVLDKNYKVGIKDGDTVYKAMQNLQNDKNSTFSFSYKEYPSLGIFIDGINEVKGEPGEYWIYYVNDIEASVSVSKYQLKEGDIISWKQE
jgi:hypothetical protein